MSSRLHMSSVTPRMTGICQENKPSLNTRVPSIVAETASIFGELLLTDLMLDGAKNDAERKALLCLVLDEAGMTTFQVTARVWFEQALYASIEQNEFLDYNTICRHWTVARDQIFGDAVTWFPEMQAEWTMKPHYYHGKLPLLQLSLRLRPNVRLLPLRAVSRRRQRVCA